MLGRQPQSFEELQYSEPARQMGDDPDDPFGFRETHINQCTADDSASCDPVIGSWLLRGLPCRLTRVSRVSGGRAPATAETAP